MFHISLVDYAKEGKWISLEEKRRKGLKKLHQKSISGYMCSFNVYRLNIRYPALRPDYIQ
jgi:hypothetical protein